MGKVAKWSWSTAGGGGGDMLMKWEGSPPLTPDRHPLGGELARGRASVSIAAASSVLRTSAWALAGALSLSSE